VDAGFFLRGLVVGFSIAAPVGPIGVLCIRRTLAQGRAVGLVTGLGAATADATYGAVAAFGLTVVSSFLLAQRGWLQAIGGAFLLYLGARTWLAPPAMTAASAKGRGLGGAYASTFVLTLTNPTTILSFVAVFAGLGLASAGGDARAAATLVAGVFLGSAAWWLILSTGVSLFRERLNLAGLRWVNRISGTIIAGFGLLALASLLR
jgi:threonine/homoserine/homoserine lactone efflux protein